MIIEGMHYNENCECENCKMVSKNMKIINMKTKRQQKEEAWEKYQAIKDQALEEYNEIEKQAYKEFRAKCKAIDEQVEDKDNK